MPTNVPGPTFGARGFMSPDEASILAGFIADFQAAFGGLLNFTTSAGAPINSTPQGQLVTSEAAIYANVMYEFMALANGVDPAFATGRMQDAIARIYFLSRLPDQSTVVTCTCIGLANTVIPLGALVRDTSGNLYYAVAGGTIPLGGSIDLEFANQVTGPIPCAANSITQIYQAIPGWDTVSNASAGILGRNVEGRAEFEARREASIFNNSKNFAPSILGAVLKVDGVLDAYVVDNQNGYPLAINPDAVITATIVATTLTVSSVISGIIVAGQTITGADGLGVGVAAGTTIVSGSGTSWVVSISQTVTATNMNLGGTILVPHSLYVAVVGGGESEIATAIWTKKPPGVGYNGNTTVTVYDTSPQYAPPGIPYTVVYQVPTSLSFVVLVQIARSAVVPSDAAQLIQNAVVAAFAGTDGGRRAGIGSTVFASRFYAGIEALGDWAEIVEITLGTTNSAAASFTGVIAAAVLTASSVTGSIAGGQTLFGVGIPDGVTILSQASGSPGGAGTYNISTSLTVSSEAMQTVAATLFRVPTKITQAPTVAPENITVVLV